MQSEQFDKKIKEAADHHHPDYDEKAWTKMEKLLDKHLPQQKDDRRRIIFFLFLFLLVGGGLYLIIAKPFNGNKSITVTASSKTDPQTVSPESNKKTGSDLNEANKVSQPIGDQISHTEKDDEKLSSISKLNSPVDQSLKPLAASKKLSRIMVKKTFVPLHETNDIQNNATRTNQSDNEPSSKNDNNATTNLTDNGKSLPHSINTQNENETGNQQVTSKTSFDSIQTKSSAILTPRVSKNKSKDKERSSFFVSLSGAPDVSFTSLDRMGKLRLTGGAGIGYNYRNKFTLRTGFYIAKKVYSASNDQYHLPSYSWLRNYEMINIDADCKVFEVPLSFSYIIKHNEKQSWLGTIGMSSYFMKKETYNYFYKNSTGQPAQWNWTLNNGYDHYFAILALSAGYQRNINKTFSIMAEPYLEIPVRGVGYGKVKLNSTGLLFSVIARPFSAKAKSK